MKILSASVENFASYKNLDFNFDAKGLTLIQGETGSGKSTLCDVIPWILFGKTAKNGSVDEILTWPGDKAAKGTISIQTATSNIHITRIRGKGSNDLYYVDSILETTIRGKDLADTQRLINAVLGFNPEVYLAGAYFHEFAQTAQFFITTAKNRRAICEQIVDLTLAKNLQEKTTAKIKLLNMEMSDLKTKLDRLEEALKLANTALDKGKMRLRAWNKEQLYKLNNIKNKQANWDFEQKEHILSVKANYDTYEKERYKYIAQYQEALTETQKTIEARKDAEMMAKESIKETHTKECLCQTCGQVIKSAAQKQSEDLKKSIDAWASSRQLLEEKFFSLTTLIDKTLKNINPFQEQLKQEKTRVNTYALQLSEIEAEVNPFIDYVENLENEIIKQEETHKELSEQLIYTIEESNDFDLLLDVIAEFRNTLIQNAIQAVEQDTNNLLSKYFDAELSISLDVQESDKLEAVITRNGNTCSYTQLSKGQRQLLKLSFGVAVMRAVSNHSGVKLDAIFFDEALDGLDESLKVKAKRLFDSLALEYNSVFVVDHSEALKASFDNKYTVQLVNGTSQIE